MRRTLSLIAWSVALFSCSACSTGSETPADSGARRIRLGYAGVIDFGDLPSVIAQQRLRDEGYEVEVIQFSAPDVVVEAVARGSADVIHATNVGTWTAIAHGAQVRTVMNHVADAYRLVVTPDISTCADLDGRRVGSSVESSISTQLFLAYVREECPDAEPQILHILQLDNRAAAFVSGGLDAGPLDLGTLLWLQRQAPGKFSVLSNFSQRWPTLKTAGVHVNTDFAAAHPDIVVAYLAATIRVIRDIHANPALLVSAAEKHMGLSNDWHAAAQAYLDEEMWPPDGGLTTADVEESLAFFKTYSKLDPSLTAGAVADLSFLERARATTH